MQEISEVVRFIEIGLGKQGVESTVILMGVKLQLMGIKLQDKKSYRDQLFNTVNVFDTTELHLKIGKQEFLPYVSIFLNNRKCEKKKGLDDCTGSHL